MKFIYCVILVLQILLSKSLKQDKLQKNSTQKGDDNKKIFIQLKTNVKSLEQLQINMLMWSNYVLDRTQDFNIVIKSQDYNSLKSSLDRQSKLNISVQNKIRQFLDKNSSTNDKQQLQFNNELKKLHNQLIIQSYSAQYLQDQLDIREQGVDQNNSKVKFFKNNFNGPPSSKW